MKIKDSTRSKLLAIFKAPRKDPMTYKELYKKAGITKANKTEYLAALQTLKDEGKLIEENGMLNSSAGMGLVTADMVKVNATFGFAHVPEQNGDVFIPGRYLKQALPGDKVLIRVSRGRGDLPEGQVVRILEEAQPLFTGIVILTEKECQIQPDSYLRFPIPLSRKKLAGAKHGDKVLAYIISRGDERRQPLAQIKESFGSAELAKNCCASILAANDIIPPFSQPVLDEAKTVSDNGIHPKEAAARLDLREELIFTIDGADTKDIDDAISLKKLPDGGWELGVHIADVSWYVTPGSALDAEAFRRGTSVYYADSVVPMLPPELSNGICSLNPKEDRLAFSALMTLNATGHMTGYRFEKTLIRSCIKGVYSEINALLDNSASPEIEEKYKPVLHILPDMKALAAMLMDNRYKRGSMEIESTESKIKVDEEGRAVEISARQRGFSEGMIEEFMLVANEAAATLALSKGLPFIFRVHEHPAAERLQSLYETLASLNVDAGKPKTKVTAQDLLDILGLVKGTNLSRVVNTMVLRSMAKAKYSEINLGHFGLVLKNYTHFTSPIRRYPDLCIHRILSAYVTGMKMENIHKRYDDFVGQASARSTEREIGAMQAERKCEDCYKAEFMRPFLGETVEGIVSSIAPHGMYVELPNTVEGMIALRGLAGEWEAIGNVALTDKLTGRRFQVGDSLKVLVAGVDVSAGQIDFQLTEN
ncbi:ribonuclease R [Oscillospiraceae bacterium MB08-C2-2]|nr:ribonuclease R [Oscillospiraceae bacterium MB08-C2-2]